MRFTFRLMLGAAIVLSANVCGAVEPAYEGRFGNPEEPALRPLKWLWSGARALGHQTKKSLIHGNMKVPVIGSVEGLRGLRRGVVELSQSTVKGAVFAPVPDKDRFKETHAGNRVIEEDRFLRNTSDFAFSLYAYPVLKAVDACPLEDEETVQAREKVVEEKREAKKAANTSRGAESSRKGTQRRYVGGRIPFAGDNGRPPAKNYLKGAK